MESLHHEWNFWSHVTKTMHCHHPASHHQVHLSTVLESGIEKDYHKSHYNTQTWANPMIEALHCQVLKQTRTATPMSGGTRKTFLRNPPISLSISLLWLPCMFLVWFRWLPLRLPLNETMDVSAWNVGHILKAAWKWSSWNVIWEQDGTNVSFISDIHECVLFVFCN